jgi:hypothetical protein
MAKKRIDPDEKARWAEGQREFRQMYERRLQRMAEWDAAEERRRARLRRLTFGLLGRA